MSGFNSSGVKMLYFSPKIAINVVPPCVDSHFDLNEQVPVLHLHVVTDAVSGLAQIRGADLGSAPLSIVQRGPNKCVGENGA